MLYLRRGFSTDRNEIGHLIQIIVRCMLESRRAPHDQGPSDLKRTKWFESDMQKAVFSSCEHPSHAEQMAVRRVIGGKDLLPVSCSLLSAHD